MKKSIKFSIMFLLISLFITVSLNAGTKTVYTLGSGGSLRWNGFVDEACKCHAGGNDCKIQITTTESIAVATEGGWTLSQTVDYLEYEVTPVGGDPFTEQGAGENYQFPNPSELHIIECTEFPELVGRIIDISNITTDANGSFQVFIPEE